MERKDFIKQCTMLCMGGVALSLLHSCKGNYYAISTIKENSLAVKKTEFIEVKDGKSKNRKYVLLRTEKLPFPICIFKLNETAYSALLMECTHKSCELNPHGDYLICPCHGSEFSNLGVVQNPPAETNLTTYKVNQDNENIYIQI
jgi:Rieske Fe-S protein